jgi:hypothetical protein
MDLAHAQQGPTRPPAKAVQAFRPEQAGRDTVRTYLSKGWSLAICCKDCPRLVEWTPDALHRRFSGRLDLRIADQASRLTSAGDDGCGSARVAVFPHPFEGDWSWTSAADEPS